MEGNEFKQEITERKRKERNERETFHYKAMTIQTHKQPQVELASVGRPNELSSFLVTTRKLLKKVRYPVFHCLMGCYNREWSHLTCFDLNKTEKNLGRLECKIDLDYTKRKSYQVNASWPNILL